MIKIIGLLLICGMCYADGYPPISDSQGVIDTLQIENTIRKLDRQSNYSIKASSVQATYRNSKTADNLYLLKSSATETTSSLQIGNLFFQWGWNSIQGNGTEMIGLGVTYTTAFVALPTTVLIGSVGETNVAPPSTIDKLITPSGAAYTVMTTSITASGFHVDISAETGVNFIVGTYYGFSWLAIGKKN